MKRKIIGSLLSICITAAVTMPAYAVTADRTYVTSSNTSDDGYTSSSYDPSSSSSTNTQQTQNTEISDKDANRILSALTGNKTTDTQAPASYVKDGRYYNTWAGRSLSVSNGISNFGDNVYVANSWKRNAIIAQGTAYRSPEWDRQIGHDVYWSNDAYNYRPRTMYEEEKPQTNNSSQPQTSAGPSAPNVITYGQIYGSGSSKNGAIPTLQSTYLTDTSNKNTNNAPINKSSTTNKTATVNQTVANTIAEEQREAERNAQSGGVTEGVAKSSYPYVNILGAVKPSEYDTFNSHWKKVITSDPELVNVFKNNNWKIILTTADLNQLLYNGETTGVTGCTVENKKAIYVQAGDHSDCVIHEMGHFLDFMAGEGSKSTAFKKLYEEEGTNLSNYGASSADEFFAEVYYYFITDPTTLKNKAPKSYSYLIDIKKSVTGV